MASKHPNSQTNRREISWEEYGKYCDQLADLTKHLKVDYIYGLPRGGLVPAICISHHIKKGILVFEDYKAVTLEEIYYSSKPFKYNKKKLLIVDDLVDSGRQIQNLISTNRLDFKRLKIATLFYKPWSRIKPDYYIEETESWIQFPYERS